MVAGGRWPARSRMPYLWVYAAPGNRIRHNEKQYNILWHCQCPTRPMVASFSINNSTFHRLLYTHALITFTTGRSQAGVARGEEGQRVPNRGKRRAREKKPRDDCENFFASLDSHRSPECIAGHNNKRQCTSFFLRPWYMPIDWVDHTQFNSFSDNQTAKRARNTRAEDVDWMQSKPMPKSNQLE